MPEHSPELGPCWLWTGRPNQHGYGRFRSGGQGSQTVPAHRWSYEGLVAEIPDGLVLDHLCRTRHCVNPYHLDPVPNAVNVLRGESFSAANAAKTECPEGHPYSQENTYVHPTTGGRLCLTCKRMTDRASQARHRAAQRAGRNAR
nr:HNH endonuclease [Streptomyces echinoruber]